MSQGPGELYFRSGTGPRITTDQALSLFLDAIARGQTMSLTKTKDDAMGRRSLHARIGGEVILQSYEPSRGWHAQIESLRALLLATAADVLNAFVRITSTDVLSRQAAKDQPPGAPMSGLLGSWNWSITHLEGTSPTPTASR